VLGVFDTSKTCFRGSQCSRQTKIACTVARQIWPHNSMSIPRICKWTGKTFDPGNNVVPLKRPNFLLKTREMVQTGLMIAKTWHIHAMTMTARIDLPGLCQVFTNCCCLLGISLRPSFFSYSLTFLPKLTEGSCRDLATVRSVKKWYCLSRTLPKHALHLVQNNNLIKKEFLRSPIGPPL
jgi:hypothetical protein